MNDHVTQFLRATERADVAAIMTTLSPEATLTSPLVGGAEFSNPRDLEVLLEAVYSTLRDLRWNETYRDGAAYTVLGTARVLGRPLHDAMILSTDDLGRISRIQPHLAPWSGLTAFALALGPKLARHPGVLRRATTRG